MPYQCYETWKELTVELAETLAKRADAVGVAPEYLLQQDLGELRTCADCAVKNAINCLTKGAAELRLLTINRLSALSPDLRRQVSIIFMRLAVSIEALEQIVGADLLAEKDQV